MELRHGYEMFLNADEMELLYVDEEDDTGEDRPVFGWGPSCPIEMNAGVRFCYSFITNHNSCRSVVSESMARNYLARHCFSCSNHRTYLDKQASFQAANSVPIVMTTETLADRNLYRRAEELERKEQVRDRDRHRGQRNRVNVAFGSKGGGKHRKGKDGEANVATRSASSSSSAAVVDDRVARKSQAVKVQLEELETLEACIGRAIESQKRTMESFNYFSRMIQDERQVFAELMNALAELISKAKKNA